MRKVSTIAIAVATLMASGLALAGSTTFSQVSILPGVSASGSMVGARNSADTVQFIQCTTYANYAPNTPPYEYGSCFAKNAAGAYIQCFIGNSQQLAVMRSVGPASYIYFKLAADGYTCGQVTVTNSSSRIQY